MLRLVDPPELRRIVDAIPDTTLTIPNPSPKNLNGKIYIEGRELRELDYLLLEGGFRISEVAQPSGQGSNTSHSLKVFAETHHDTGEEALRIQVYALKKKLPILRDVARPLNPKYDPWTKPILDHWERDGSPKLNRFNAARANRHILAGIGYTVKGRIIYRRDPKGKLLKNGDGKKTVETIVPQHPKQGADHVFRHACTKELKKLQLNGTERRVFFRWSAQADGAAATEDNYDPEELEWYEYFHKMLRPII